MLVPDSEQNVCIVSTQAFKDSTNPFAIRNLLLYMHKSKKIRLNDKPKNSQMRFGFYRSAVLFIGNLKSNI